MCVRVGTALLLSGLLASTSLARPARAQTPQPFPRPSEPAPPSTTPGRTARPAPPPAAPPKSASDAAEPTEETLGFVIYPAAQFIASYDAGRGQRYYLFGSTATFADLVNYYRAVLKERGHLVFDEPPTHMFEVGRFRDDSMAFPPGVTIKDYTWGGGKGYPNPRRPADPARFPSVIMIVPAPASAAQP